MIVLMMKNQEWFKNIYEEKYINRGNDNWVLVAPMTSGSKVLQIFGFEKTGDIYPEFQDKQVTDIWWWLSSLAFELLPNIQKIIIVDPIFAYDRKTYIKREKERGERRTNMIEILDNNLSEDILKMRQENNEKSKKVVEGIQQWENYDFAPDSKIELNSSFAQNIVWIWDNSQDVIFFNFVLDKLQGGNKDVEGNIILSVLEKAYIMLKSWGKMYGIHNKGNSENKIINALSNTDYKRDAEYKDDYVVFIIDKE